MPEFTPEQKSTFFRSFGELRTASATATIAPGTVMEKLNGDLADIFRKHGHGEDTSSLLTTENISRIFGGMIYESRLIHETVRGMVTDPLTKIASNLGIEKEVEQASKIDPSKARKDNIRVGDIGDLLARLGVTAKPATESSAANIIPLSTPAATVEFKNGEDNYMKEVTSVGVNRRNGELHIKTFPSSQQKAVNLAHALNEQGISNQIGEHRVVIGSANAKEALSYLSGGQAGKFAITPECAAAARAEHQKAISPNPPFFG